MKHQSEVPWMPMAGSPDGIGGVKISRALHRDWAPVGAVGSASTADAGVAFYDPDGYPHGVPNPHTPRVHAWRGGPLNEGSRFHGPNWTRIQSRPRFAPHPLFGLGQVEDQMRVDTRGGSFATRGYGGGVFNQRVGVMGLGDGTPPNCDLLAKKAQDDYRSYIYMEAKLAARAACQVQALNAGEDDSGCDAAGDAAGQAAVASISPGKLEMVYYEAYNPCMAQVQDDFVVPTLPKPPSPPPRPAPQPAPPPPAPSKSPDGVPLWAEVMFWGGIGAAVVTTGYLVLRKR